VIPHRPAVAARLTAAAAALAAALAALAAPGAERVVSIGGAVTEIVYALGAGQRLVAVDSTSRHPPAATRLPQVGYMRALSAEPVLALDPTLILAVADAGPPTALAQLREAGVRVVRIPDQPSAQGVERKIRAVAAALQHAARGDALAASFREQMHAARALTARATRRPRVLFLLSAGHGSPLAAGDDTAAAAMIRLAAGENAMRGVDGFAPVSAEALVAAAPEIVLVTERTLDRLGGEAGLLAAPGIAATPAGAARRVVVMDGLLLLGFGPRTPRALRELTLALHPELEDGS